MEFGIYVHIPFCERICPYCDFNTYAVTNIPEKEYSEAILKQLDNQKELFQDYKLVSIYFGGGTPSLFSVGSIKNILNKINQIWKIDSKEITIELNPEHINEEYLSELSDTEINRISIGLQSTRDERLKFLGRKHKYKIDDYLLLKKFKFNNFNLDLMFGLENETLEILEDEIDQYLEINPNHISCYQLTVENGTGFSAKYPKSQIVSSDYSADAYELIIDKLAKNKLFQYEISNFAQVGYESRHNILYWSYQPYLGLGAGAHSFNLVNNKVTRWQMVNKFNNYILNQEILYSENLEDFKFDFVFSNLRKLIGFKISEFENIFKEDVFKSFPNLKELSINGLIEINESVKLTKKGLFLYNTVLEELVNA